MIAPGNYTFGPNHGSLLLRVDREGVAKSMGHDLVIEAHDWSADIDLTDDLTTSSVTATIQVASLEVREGHGGAKSLSDKDKADIKKNINDKVLNSRKFPTITFASTTVKPLSGNQTTVTGNLTICGQVRPADLELTVADDGSATGTMRVVQSQWGIKPFSALLGALKVKDEVVIEITTSAPAA